MPLTLNRYLEITTSSEFLSWKWKDRGSCVEACATEAYEPMDWFPLEESWVPPRIAVVCDSCPVRLECLSAAIYTHEVKGIWGGKPIKSIRRMRRKINAALRGRIR